MATRVVYILVLSTYTRYSRISMRQICQTVLKSEKEEILCFQSIVIDFFKLCCSLYLESSILHATVYFSTFVDSLTKVFLSFLAS